VDPNAPEPKTDGKKVAGTGTGTGTGTERDKPVVVVPQDLFVYPDRKRVFYRVQVADTLKDVCDAFKVAPDEVRRWNGIDPTARLVESMTLQLFVPASADLSSTVVLGENDVRVVTPGTDEFFRHWEEKGRHRTLVTAKAGDTLDAIGKRYGMSGAMMERINRRGRSEALAEGESVVVWVPGPAAKPAAATATASADPPRPALAKAPPAPEPTSPLGGPPAPDLLPALP
jgi:membrane-bound lytic murein transglycosylase D